jgi:ubiquinone/menaquinone biosynthesis C-methylase UbiE
MKILPEKLRQYLKNRLGIQFLLDQNEQLVRRVAMLESQLYESRDDLEQDARHRWEISNPDVHLTWGEEISGDAFITQAMSYDLFGKDKNVLEIGPGYGRLLTSMLKKEVEFAGYLGVDISESQVHHLSKSFADENTNFVQGNAETFNTDNRFDVLISSLTLKHIFPTFEKAIGNVSRFMNPGALTFIDFIEGDSRKFEDDGQTYVRHYTRDELTNIMGVAGFEIVNFDVVKHTDEHSRLVVIARKTD